MQIRRHLPAYILPIALLAGSASITPSHAQNQAPATTPGAAAPAETGTATGTTAGATTMGTATGSTAPAMPANGQASTMAAGKASANVENRLSELKSKLNIGANQEQAWNDFANTMRQNAQREDALFQQQVPPGQQTALQAMRSYAQITQTHAENVARLEPKFETLYNQLTPAQQKAADQTFAEHRKQALQHEKHG